MTQAEPQKITLAILRVGLAVLAILSMIASLYPEWRLWGVDALRVFPLTVRIVLTAAMLSLLAPRVRSASGGFVERWSDKLATGGMVWLYLAISGLLVTAFFLWPSQNHLLGDGYTLLKNISGGSPVSSTEPLDYVLHHVVYRLLAPANDAAIWSYRICSYVAGALFLIGLYFSVERRQLLMVLLPGVLTFAAVQFFFGYVESYTLAFTFCFLYLVAARKDIAHKRISLSTIVLLMLAIGFHLSSATLLPSLVYLLWNRSRRKATLILSAAALLILFAGGFLYAHQKLQLEQIFLPLVATASNPYHLFSPAHLLDLLNIFLLDYPLLLLLLPALIISRSRHRLFYLAALLPALLFVAITDPKIGALRDWDLLAAASAPAIIAVIWILTDQAKNHGLAVYSLALPLLLFAILHSGSWIAANSSKDFSYEYIATLTESDPHYGPGYYGGYRNKAWAKTLYDEYQDYPRVIDALERRVAGAPDDNLNRYNLAKSYYTHAGKYQKAAELVDGIWREFLSYPEIVSTIATMLKSGGHKDEYDKLCEAVAANGGTEPDILYGYASSLEVRGQYDSAFSYYTMALQNWADAPAERLLGFYLFCLERDHTDAAQSSARSLEHFLPPKSRPLIDQLRQAVADKNRTAVDSLKEEISGQIH